MCHLLRQNKSENYGRVFYHCQGQLAAMLCLIGFVPNQILVRIQSCLTPALQLCPYIVHLLRIILMELYWWSNHYPNPRVALLLRTEIKKIKRSWCPHQLHDFNKNTKDQNRMWITDMDLNFPLIPHNSVWFGLDTNTLLSWTFF